MDEPLVTNWCGMCVEKDKENKRLREALEKAQDIAHAMIFDKSCPCCQMNMKDVDKIEAIQKEELPGTNKSSVIADGTQGMRRGE